MIKALIDFERIVLPSLLDANFDGEWHSLDINYGCLPRVERLWRKVDGTSRILIHMMAACGKDEEAFLHPHPWPAAIHAHTEYVMRSGAGPHDGPPPDVTLEQNIDRDTYFEMPHINGWHSMRVRNDEVGFLTMLIGEPWYVSKSAHLNLRPVEPERHARILELFRTIYRCKEHLAT